MPLPARTRPTQNLNQSRASESLRRLMGLRDVEGRPSMNGLQKLYEYRARGMKTHTCNAIDVPNVARQARQFVR